MNRTILVRVATLPVLAGLFLCTACLFGAWHVNRLHTAFASILAENVFGMKAAQQLEIAARQLRFHSFLSLIDPTPSVSGQIDDDRRQFEIWLGEVEPTSKTLEERALLAEIHSRYDQYWREFEQAKAEPRTGNRNVSALAAAHTVRPLTEPCRELLRFNEKQLDAAVHRSEEMTRRLQWAMLLLGLGGPLGGLVSGYGIARGLSRSLHRLSVRVQDMAQHLDQDVADVALVPGTDLREIDRQLEHVVARVAEAAERFQRQQREMLRAQQLAAVGQLAASMAHEIRNPLTSIKMLVEAALRADRPRPFTAGNLNVVHDEIRRLERTVQGLLDFARPQSPDRRPCDMRAIASAAVELVRARARQQRVEIDLQASGEPLDALVDRDQLSGVLVNLLVNALDAMPNGGRLGVVVRRPDAETIEFVVDDTGQGIAAEMMDTLFTPFESDKPTGCGLGLSIAKQVVEAHGGSISAANKPEGGARFAVSISASTEG